MARDRGTSEDFAKPIRAILVGSLVTLLLAIFLVWRIDSPRVERFRIAFIDRVVPSFDWALLPVNRFVEMVGDFQSYTRIYDQNQELRRELQQMRTWKEAALQLEQENAKLLDLNKVRLDPKFTYVTGVVLMDSGSPFRQSVMVNVGSRDGIRDGWATMDGVGLVGRISGVGEAVSRVVMLTDSNSRIPVTIQPSGQRAIVAGDNSSRPPIEFLENQDLVRPGDRVMSSGDGGLFPAGLLIGEAVLASDGRLRVNLAADYQRLEFLRVLRSHEAEPLTDPGGLIRTEAITIPMTLPEPEGAGSAEGVAGSAESAANPAADGAAPEAPPGADQPSAAPPGAAPATPPRPRGRPAGG